jgi:hypothetical protein
MMEASDLEAIDNGKSNKMAIPGDGLADRVVWNKGNPVANIQIPHGAANSFDASRVVRSEWQRVTSGA